MGVAQSTPLDDDLTELARIDLPIDLPGPFTAARYGGGPGRASALKSHVAWPYRIAEPGETMTAARPHCPDLDMTDWPRVRIVMYESRPEFIAPFIDALLKLADRGPFVTVADARRATAVDAATRQRLFEGFRRVQATGQWRAEALILNDPLLRGIATAYSWVRRSSAPFRVFATFADAERWMDKTQPAVLSPTPASAHH
jgi:hypothetical protein